jgi:hypothetical protein
MVYYKDLYGRDPGALAALEMMDGGASLGKKPKSDQVASK